MKVVHNGHGILVSPNRQRELRSLIDIAVYIKKAKLLEPSSLNYDDVKKLIMNCTLKKEETILHFNITNNAEIDAIEALNVYTNKANEEVLNGHLISKQIHIIVTLNEMEVYDRLREAYPKFIDSVQVVFVPHDSAIASTTLMNTIDNFIADEEPSSVFIEAYKVISAELKDIDKIRFYSFAHCAIKFHRILVKAYKSRGSYLNKLKQALQIFREWHQGVQVEQKMWEQQYVEEERELWKLKKQLEEQVNEFNELVILCRLIRTLP